MQMSVDLLRSVFGNGGVVVELVDGDEMVYAAINADHARYLGLRLSRHTSLSGQAAREGLLLHCADAHDDPRVDRKACDSVGIRSMVCAPLFQDGEPVGVLKAFDAAPNAFDRDDIETVTLVAETVGAALAKQLAYREREGLLMELAMARDEAEAEARRARMAESMGGLGHWRYDYAAGRVDWSDEMYDLHGLERGAPLDRDTVLGMVHAEDLPRVEELLANATPFREGRPFTNFRLTRADGVERRLEAMTAIELGPNGERAAIMGVVRDVTERYERELELAQARREAEAAARTKAAFLANMTHELRTPLTAVLGFSRLMNRRGDLPEDSRVMVRRIMNAGEALLHTINDILDFSKLEDGQVEIRPRPISMAECVGEAVELLTPLADAKRLALDVAVDPATPPWVLADPERVRQLVLNLAGNAVKFTHSGTVLVELGPSADGDALVCSVTDTGPGIASDGVGRLFQRYSQVKGGGHEGGGGTGLGLAICKGLIDAMGGTIGVQSAPGEGSRFWFSLPLRAVQVDGLSEPEDQSAGINGRSVLVADDNPANRVLLRTILQAFGAEVAEARDGGEAVDMAGARDFDLILMDLRMPGLDGASAARRIHDAGGARITPILAFSADRDPELDATLFRGAVPKPVEPGTLLAAMVRAMA